MRIVALALSASLLSGCSLQEYASDETNDIIDVFVNSITSGDLSEELANGALLHDSIDIHSNVVDPSLFSLDIKSVENAPAKVPVPLSLEGPVNGGISSNTGNDVLEITDASQDDDYYTREKFKNNGKILVAYVYEADQDETDTSTSKSFKEAFVPMNVKTKFCLNYGNLDAEGVQEHFDALGDSALVGAIADNDESECTAEHKADKSIEISYGHTLPKGNASVKKFVNKIGDELKEDERKYSTSSKHAFVNCAGDITDSAFAFRANIELCKLCILVHYSSNASSSSVRWYGDNSAASKLANELKNSAADLGLPTGLTDDSSEYEYLAKYATDKLNNDGKIIGCPILVLKLKSSDADSIDKKKFVDEIVKAVNGE